MPLRCHRETPIAIFKHVCDGDHKDFAGRRKGELSAPQPPQVIHFYNIGSLLHLWNRRSTLYPPAPNRRWSLAALRSPRLRLVVLRILNRNSTNTCRRSRIPSQKHRHRPDRRRRVMSSMPEHRGEEPFDHLAARCSTKKPLLSAGPFASSPPLPQFVPWSDLGVSKTRIKILVGDRSRMLRRSRG
jgi:transposase